MASKPLSVAEARSLYKETTLNGQKYSYILSEPKDRKLLNTIFLIHGFPDISYGWRNQIPFLTSLGLRVVVPDMLGYGGSSTSSDPKFMTYKRAADDIAALAKELGLSRIILGGHDWGGATVYRVALFYPELVSAVFSVCTPFGAPGPKYKDMAEMPNFKYQIQFRGEELVEKIVGVEKIRQCLNAMYGGRTKDKELGFAVEHGVYLDMISECGHTPLMSKEDLDFYVERFSRNGMQGPTNVSLLCFPGLWLPMEIDSNSGIVPANLTMKMRKLQISIGQLSNSKCLSSSLVELVTMLYLHLCLRGWTSISGV
jgi:soluble epoxide hydrolase/lipid-phosphate phosphatase